MSTNFENWKQELLDVDTAENHRASLAEIELLVLESNAADNKRVRLKLIWLLRHFKQLV